MLKIARACCIVAVAASATLSVMAESTAATSKVDPKPEEIVQRMKAMRLPEVSFKPPATLADAVEFFRVASKDFDRPKIPKGERGFNIVLRLKDGDAPEIPKFNAVGITFYDALKLVREAAAYEFSVIDGNVIIKPKEAKP